MLRSLVRAGGARLLCSSRSSCSSSGGGAGAGTDISGLHSRVCAVLGAQWGDEGKGKLVDVYAGRYDIVARFNGGANAGHTLVVNGRKFAFHLLPCGLLYPGKKNVIGNGVVLHAATLFEELAQLDDAGVEWKGNLLVSDRAHLLFDFHQAVDGRQEDALKGANIGTTKKGIGPCYASKATRHGVRVGELLHFDSFKRKLAKIVGDVEAQYGVSVDLAAEVDKYKAFAERLRPMITDTSHFLNDAYRNGGKTILAEGANAALLDIDHGTYPFVTSSSTSAGGICTGLGLAPTILETTVGVVKAYTTRVGSGPFPTELDDASGQHLRDEGGEYGTTTGRPRRCGWLDLPVVHYSHMLNNYQSINITKLDVLSKMEEIKIGTHYLLNGKRLPTGFMPGHLDDLAAVEVEYETMPGWMSDISNCRTFEELPVQAQDYITAIEKHTGVPVSWIGVGAGREAMAVKGFTLDG